MAVSLIMAVSPSGEGMRTHGDWDRRVLHEEIARLPERYRVPMVLCGLEGLTQEQAAQRLRWPVGTVKSRLARGREKLRVRLARRGLAPATGLAAVVAVESSPAGVPSTLAKATICAAQRMVACQLPAGVISAATLKLMKGTMRAMFIHKLRNAAIIAALPLGVVVASLELLPASLLGGALEATVAAGATAAEPDQQIASLLGSWRRVDPGFEGSHVSIKLLSTDPGIAKGLGVEAPFVFTLTIMEPGKTDPKPYQLAFVDPAPTPPRMTFLPLYCGARDEGSPESGYPAIYRVDGETLTIHSSNGRAPRPTDFEVSNDRMTHLEVYRREPNQPSSDSK